MNEALLYGAMVILMIVIIALGAFYLKTNTLTKSFLH